MAKLWEMSAHYTQGMKCIVKTPDNWTAKDVEKHYAENGADGQFQDDHGLWGDWVWGEAYQIDDDVQEDDDLTHLETMSKADILAAMRVLKLTAKNVENGENHSLGLTLKNLAALEGELQFRIDQLEDE